MRCAFFALPVHAQRHRGEPAVEHPAFVGLQNVAEHDAAFAQPVDERGVAGQRHAGQQVAEARQVLGGRVEHDVGAKRDGVLQDGTEKSVVHHDQRVVGMARGGFGGAVDVGHGHGGVGGRFDEHHAQVLGRADGFLQSAHLSGGNASRRDSPRLQQFVDQAHVPP